MTEQSAPQEIIAKCGEPDRKESKTEPVVGRNALGNPIRLDHTTTTERWYYQLSKGALPRVVTVIDGKVTALAVIDR